MGFDETLKHLQDGLFGVLFITNKNSNHNLALHLTGMVSNLCVVCFLYTTLSKLNDRDARELA
jgi:hypothetical protein